MIILLFKIRITLTKIEGKISKVNDICSLVLTFIQSVLTFFQSVLTFLQTACYSNNIQPQIQRGMAVCISCDYLSTRVQSNFEQHLIFLRP